jgi:hypothetical protein
MEGFFLLIPLFIIIAIVVRLAAGGLDQDRVRQYVESRGGKLIEASWEPFGPGWFGEKSDRIYAVRYLDGAGHEHQAHCKTSLWTGVYFTEDRIVKHADRADRQQPSLEEENRRLREELDRLRRERG